MFLIFDFQWLEAFVSTGAAQIQAVGVGVNKVCQELGISNGLIDTTIEGSEAQHDEPRATIIGSIRELLADTKTREQDSMNLQTAINGLIAALNEDMRKNAEMRNAYSE